MNLSPQEINRILIVKTSSLGDIVQSIGVLGYLHERFPHVKIDWVVEEGGKTLVEAHPLVNRVIYCDTKAWKKGLLKASTWLSLFRFLKNLRKNRYDVLFDLQGNTKSAVWTLLARAKDKVGFGFKTAREWPNILSTKTRWNAPKGINIRLQHIGLLKEYFRDGEVFRPEKFELTLKLSEKERVEQILTDPRLQGKKRVMVCPGSKWKNKQLEPEEWKKLLELLAQRYNFSFLLLWGTLEEKTVCERIMKDIDERSLLVDLLPLPTWQNLIAKMDLVIAIDSSALHFAGMAQTPSFSFFGPTSPEVFKPVGATHFAVKGICPYGKVFPKQCSRLRSCPTGACMKNLKAEDLFASFSSWWEKSS